MPRPSCREGEPNRPATQHHDQRPSPLQVRPLSTKELVQDEAKPCVQVAPNGVQNQLMIGADKKFTFDHVIGPEQGQQAVYDGCVKPLVEGCLAGYNSCILAYGQTVS